jgi:hypothetical protein
MGLPEAARLLSLQTYYTVRRSFRHTVQVGGCTIPYVSLEGNILAPQLGPKYEPNKPQCQTPIEQRRSLQSIRAILDVFPILLKRSTKACKLSVSPCAEFFECVFFIF